MGNKLVWHQVVLFGVLLSLTAWRFFSGEVRPDVNLLWWWLGSVVGFLFVFCDRFVYALISNSDEVGSLKIKDLFAKGKLVEGVAVVFSEREKPKHLVMRSILFVFVWMVLSVFTATSVASLFSRGLLLGLGTHLIFDLLWDYWRKQDMSTWFWQIKKITPQETTWFVRGSLVFYLLIIWFL